MREKRKEQESAEAISRLKKLRINRAILEKSTSPKKYLSEA